MNDIDTFFDDMPQDNPLDLYIAWTLPNGSEMVSVGGGDDPNKLAASIIAAGAMPAGTPWRVVSADYVPILPLGVVRQGQLDAVNAAYEQAMAYVQSGYPLTEVLSWERQATQARELQANPDAEAAFVRALAATKGVPVEEMARRILANAAAWEPMAAYLTAQRQMLEDRVLAAETEADILAVTPTYSFV